MPTKLVADCLRQNGILKADGCQEPVVVLLFNLSRVCSLTMPTQLQLAQTAGTDCIARAPNSNLAHGAYPHAPTLQVKLILFAIKSRNVIYPIIVLMFHCLFPCLSFLCEHIVALCASLLNCWHLNFYRNYFLHPVAQILTEHDAKCHKTSGMSLSL